jgi:hypothetical protein
MSESPTRITSPLIVGLIHSLARFLRAEEYPLLGRQVVHLMKPSLENFSSGGRIEPRHVAFEKRWSA